MLACLSISLFEYQRPLDGFSRKFVIVKALNGGEVPQMHELLKVVDANLQGGLQDLQSLLVESGTHTQKYCLAKFTRCY